MERSNICVRSFVTRYFSEKNNEVMTSVNMKNGMDMRKAAEIYRISNLLMKLQAFFMSFLAIHSETNGNKIIPINENKVVTIVTNVIPTEKWAVAWNPC